MNMQEARVYLSTNLPWIPTGYSWNVGSSSTALFDLPAIRLMISPTDPAKRDVLNTRIAKVRISKNGVTKRKLNKLIRKSQSLALEVYKTQTKEIESVSLGEIAGTYRGGNNNARTRWERFCDYMMEWD